MITIKNAGRVAGALLTAAGLSACGQPTQWVNPNLTNEQAQIQFYECKRDGQNMIAMSASNLFVAIQQTQERLQAHGFRPDTR